MKLASLKSTLHRDGQLCLVEKNLNKAVLVTDIAPTLQYAIEHWDEVLPLLHQRNEKLHNNQCPDHFDFNPRHVSSPLPRAFQWADGSAYVNHVELVRKARGAEMPMSFWTDPLIYQGGSDDFLAPYDPISGFSADMGIDFEAEVAVITGDVPMGATLKQARAAIKLIMLVNDVSLRHLIPQELAKGFGFFQSKPASAFSPVAITPDELGEAWDGERLHLPLLSTLNGRPFGHPNAGIDMTFSFAELIVHATKTRRLCAGTIIGSGTVSNRDPQVGSSCIAERRMLEQLTGGKALTPFMKNGDTIQIEMKLPCGQSLFGQINQKVDI